MIGAIIGDIVGSRYESWKNNIFTKDFQLFDGRCRFTDDTVMTLGTAEVCIAGFSFDSDENQEEVKFVSNVYKKWCQKFPHRGFGGWTKAWFYSDDIISSESSFANGAAMRVSPVAWFSVTLEQAEAKAKFVSEITHNSEGVKGAQAIAAATFMAIEREGGYYISSKKRATKDEIKNYIEKIYGYNLSIALFDAKEYYHHLEPRRSQASKSVPAAILAFINGDDFEDVIRTAVSLGGDTDTIAAMAGSIAEAYYGIPEDIQSHIWAYMFPELSERVKLFERERKRFNEGKYLTARNAAMKVCQLSRGTGDSFGPAAWQDALDVGTEENEFNFWSDIVYWSNYLFYLNHLDRYAILNEKFDYFSCLKVEYGSSGNLDNLFNNFTD